jgi:type IV fimbrial biogenesis protein FimT
LGSVSFSGKNSHQSGFTLIELLVTMMVFAIVAMIAAPSFKDLIDRRQIEYSTQDFEKTVIQARYDAVLGRKAVTVNLGGTGAVSPTNLYWNPMKDNDSIIFRQFVCTSSKWTGSEISGVKKLEFSSKGSVKLSSTYKDDDDNDKTDNVALSVVEVELSNPKAKYFIEITPFGKVSVKKESKEAEACTT